MTQARGVALADELRTLPAWKGGHALHGPDFLIGS